MEKRDKTIDHLRGFAMLWVIVVHVLYWGNFFNNGSINLLKSFCLFEMPLFFFVTGASNSFGRTDGYFKFVLKRYKRILIPYWVFAFICAGVSIIYFGFSSGIDFISAIKILISWLIPIDRQITSISYLTWALWFIPVYLCVVLIIPLLKQVNKSTKAILFAIALLVLFLVTCLFNLGWIQNVVFYSFWTYMGLFYSDIIQRLKQHSFRKSLCFVALIGVVVMAILYVLGEPIDMQQNKFPPNIMFGIFSLIMMSLVLLSIPSIDKLYYHIERHKLTNRVANLFSTHSMTIFLYQAFAFNLTIRFANILIPSSSIAMSVVKLILCLITTVILCAVFALIFGRVERIGVKQNN